MPAVEPSSNGQTIETCDVIVIGGGPGGAAIAILLAESGMKVVIIEKERHPRFHIGESLLPHSLPILKRLGVLDQVHEIGVFKPGAEFISEDGSKNNVFNFDRALTEGPDHAYQVRRDDFDKILFDRARDVGAITLEETTATIQSCDYSAAIVAARGVDGSKFLFHADFLVDASGRSTVTAKMREEKRADRKINSAAIYGHFRDVPRADGPRGGNIRIYLTDPGWMWQIPLPDGVTSIGLVVPGDVIAKRDRSIEEFFHSQATRNPEMARALTDAEPIGELTATGNFSYRAHHAVGPGHIKVGDAFGFIDPIFSTGVHLALSSATEAARTILEAHRSPSDRARLMRAYDRHINRRINYVSWFIYKIHDRAFREMILNPRDFFSIERAVISLLAGDFQPNRAIEFRILLFKAIRMLVQFKNAARKNEDAYGR